MTYTISRSMLATTILRHGYKFRRWRRRKTKHTMCHTWGIIFDTTDNYHSATRTDILRANTMGYTICCVTPTEKKSSILIGPFCSFNSFLPSCTRMKNFVYGVTMWTHVKQNCEKVFLFEKNSNTVPKAAKRWLMLRSTVLQLFE